MAQQESLAEQVESNRPHLRAVAYRMLGSLAEAEDAVQEAWIRLSRSDADPEQETLVANSVGLALLVILDTLTPAERIAFVLHDLFGMPFDEIATILDRAPDAARQPASRARRRVQGSSTPGPDLARQREVVDAFLAAAGVVIAPGGRLMMC